MLKKGFERSIQKKADSLKEEGFQKNNLRKALYNILTEEEREFLTNKKETQEQLNRSYLSQTSGSNCSCKEGQYTCDKSEEITDKEKELEMLGSLDNIIESIAAICKQLKKTVLKLQTISNMLKEVICKIDYRKEATLLEKCQVIVIIKEINLTQSERLLKVKIRLRLGNIIAMINLEATGDFIILEEAERLELVTETILKKECYQLNTIDKSSMS